MPSRNSTMFACAIKVICLVFLFGSLTVAVEGCSPKLEDERNVKLRNDAIKELKMIEAERKATEAKKKEAQTKQSEAPVTTDGEVMMSVQRPEGDPVLMWKAGNDGGIEGGGGTPPTVKQDKVYFVTEVSTYHWNGGKGAPAGEITLKASDGTVYGPWKATLKNKVYWVVQPEQDIPAGTYTLIDSDPSTWAQNSGSGGKGMGWAYGIPVK